MDGGYFSPAERDPRPSWTSRIIGLNVAVFALWMILGRDEGGFLARNFLVSWDALREGRLWTLLTSVFSHASFLHIFLNMYVLWSFGSLMELVMGRRAYLAFYLAAGAIASLGHSLVSAFLLGAPGLPALGASGAVSGVVLLFSLLFPREKILLLGIVPVPAIWGAVLLVGLDLWGLAMQARGGGLPIGYGAHLGGALAGLLYYVLLGRGRLAGRRY